MDRVQRARIGMYGLGGVIALAMAAGVLTFALVRGDQSGFSAEGPVVAGFEPTDRGDPAVDKWPDEAAGCALPRAASGVPQKSPANGENGTARAAQPGRFVAIDRLPPVGEEADHRHRFAVVPALNAEEVPSKPPVVSPAPRVESDAGRRVPSGQPKPAPTRDLHRLEKGPAKPRALPTGPPVFELRKSEPEAVPALQSTDAVTMHLDNIDVRQVLEMISRSYGLNVLVAPEVGGPITANFDRVPLDEAIRLILKSCGLVTRREGDILLVYTDDKYPKDDIELRVFRLDYASANDLMPAIQSLLSGAGQAFATQIDKKDNRRTKEVIVVTDTPANLYRIEQYVAQIDEAPRQVLIEAHVLEIPLSDEQRHGVNLNVLMGGDWSVDMTGFANPTASPALFARIHGSQVQALIECLRTTSDTRTLASPRVMVVNGQTAKLQVGQQLGFKVVTVTETSAMEDVKFLDTGVLLEVTPQITRDNLVLMRVSPKVSDGRINPDTLLPEEQTRQVDTDVLLHDGQGVVIGGLIQEKQANLQKKVAGLGNLYLIGWLFQRREAKRERTEIVVTLVPRVVAPDGCTNEREFADAQRSQMPILDPALHELPRPEPRLPDALHHPVRLLPVWCGDGAQE